MPEEFPKTNLTIDDAKTLVKDKCLKVAGDVAGQKAYAEIENSTFTLAECVNGIVNFTAIQDEINIASHEGELDVLFNRYCEKRPDAIQCIETFNSKLTPCLDTEERYIPEDGVENVKTLPKLVMGPKQCSDMEHLERCIVKKLDDCDEITPANIVELHVPFHKNETICRSVPNNDKQISGNAGDSLTTRLNALFVSLFITLLIYFNR
ncbi:27 kDa hemolymph protein [Eumeta japonica]|uniref:27 kDa hemolymph protein n=1 Tax=Eumeta variegata TaxID=151549 RepID=A0A4C1TGX5_EUMVA|nr:27 kDa hemolymph protein [Eumeta japonica]